MYMQVSEVERRLAQAKRETAAQEKAFQDLKSSDTTSNTTSTTLPTTLTATTTTNSTTTNNNNSSIEIDTNQITQQINEKSLELKLYKSENERTNTILLNLQQGVYSACFV